MPRSPFPIAIRRFLLGAILPVAIAGCTTVEPERAAPDDTPFRLRAGEAARLRSELLSMAQRDRFVRSRDYDAMSASDRAAALRVWESTDRENTERLRRIVSVLGFPTSDIVGEDGVRAAFRLIQHADIDPAFQEACLPMLMEAGERGAVSRVDIAYLADRVRTRQGKPQLYGTQYTVPVNEAGEAVVGANGEPVYLVPLVEDPDRLDERRRAMGLGPWAEFEARMAREHDRPPAARPRTAAAYGR